MRLTKWQKAQLRWRRHPNLRRQGGFWATLLAWVVTFVVSELLRPKLEVEDLKPGDLGDFDFPTATEGRVVPLLWGTVKIAGPNVVWYGDLRQIAITEKVKTGMFSSETIVKGFKYEVGIQFALCRGEVDELLQVWIGDDSVFTGTVTDNTTFSITDLDLFGGDDTGNGGVDGTFRFHAGSPTQTADSYLSDFQKEPVTTGDTPAYRGTCYLCPDTEPVYVGNSTSIKPWKFEVRRMPNGLSLTTAENELNSGNDVNPMSVVYEIFTDSDWGLGYLAAEINTTNFIAVAQTLQSEGNGFSMLLDNPRDASEVINLIEEQIDGVFFINQSTGKWECKLARADYTPAAQPEISDANATLENFARGSWENTANSVRVEFTDRADEYKKTFAMAQDSANVRIQDDVNISATKNYPGVKDATLANSLAWRDLRASSYPLAKAKVIVDRSFWDTNPADVFRFTWPYLGITDLPMRVQRVDFGAIEDGKIALDLIQDVFYSATPSFGDPGSSGWLDPLGTLSEMSKAQAFEAPRAMVRRDPATGGTLLNKIYAFGGHPGAAASMFEIRQRNHATTPAGDYAENGKVFQFCKIGRLTSSLAVGSAYPLTAITLTPTPDTQDDIIAAFNTPGSTFELGTELVNLIYIDDGAGDGEFCLVTGASVNGANVDLDNVYRGVFDTVQQAFASASDVYIVSSGGGISDTDIDEDFVVDVKLVPRNLSGALSEASVTTIQFTMDKRVRRPYPPSELSLNSVAWDTTSVDLEANGSGAEDYHVDVDYTRRDYRVADDAADLSEIDQLGVDALTLYSDFVTATSHDTNIEVRHDPTGTNDAVITVTGNSGTNYGLRRIDILQALNGAVPTGNLRFILNGRHVDGVDTLTSRQALTLDASITTALTGQFEFGLLSASEVSAVYTATVAGTYAFTLSSAFSGGSGDVEYRLNGGAWTSLITYGATSGSIVGVSISDTIEIRNQATDTSYLKQIDMAAAGAGQDGFAVLEG